MSAERHRALPPRASVPWVGAAVVTWILATAITLAATPDPVAPGPVEGTGVLRTDPVDGRYGPWVIATTSLGDLMLEVEEPAGLTRGATVRFSGHARGQPSGFGSIRYRTRVSIDEIEMLEEGIPVHVVVGQAVRNRVVERVSPLEGGRALLAGFLIGDTSGLTRSDEEAMRLSGLSHFVAVSGSNVALFLGLLAFAAGPLALGPKRRAAVGLAGLPVYAAATRFEPSVMRASVMAGIALLGRLVGIVLEAWQLLAAAVIVLLVADPSLSASAGFQLSALATAGVLVGARWPTRGGRIRRALAVTMGAQAAVAPLILLHFGSVPIMSPLANLLAAPLVAASTLVGAIGVAGPSFLIDIAARLAGVVLAMARGAEAWPQLSPMQFGALTLAAGAALSWPRTRGVMSLVGLVLLVVSILGAWRTAPGSSVVVLDVGQGDAILLHGGDGRYALVDGGPDEVVLTSRLREYDVDRLEIVVLTHVHADHATGLAVLPGRTPVGRVWARTAPHETAASARLLQSVERFGIPLETPEVGDVFELGSLRIVVVAPERRYQSPNDQSIVLEVRGPEKVMLLAGDIEVVAQSDLEHLRADVLKVPHQGAGTSDEEWLRHVGAELAVISVGPNQFGHPAQWVIETLERSGAEVVRTDESGDVVVPLG